MSTDLQQQNSDYNEDFDDQDNCNNQQNQQKYKGGNQNNFNDNDDDDDDEEDAGDDDDQDEKPSLGDCDGDGPKCIRLRGLPWSATHKEILDFLKNITVINGSKGIHLVTSRWDGKNTGEAFVEVQSQGDVEEALKLNKNMMGHRYIEVFTANPKEAQAAMKKTGGPGQSFVVKLRGLPYAVTEQQVDEFFNGLEIKPDREGILFVMDRRGRATGEAYVQFESQEDTEQALGRNREKIGHRYIEIFRSSLAELKRSTNGNGRPGPYDIKDRGGNRGDFGGGRNNMMRGGGGNDWNGGGGGGGGGFGVGANNTLGFNNMNYNNSGNFGNGFGNNGGGGGGNGGNFGNNGGGGFGGNNGGGGGFGGNNSRFNGPNNGGGAGGGGNFSSDFGDFGNFGNNRNFNNGSNDFTGGSGFGGRGNNGSNFGTGGNFGNMGNFGNFGNGGNDGPNNMSGGGGGGGSGGFNNSNMGNNGGGNFGPIGGGRNDNEFYSVHMRGLPYSSYENDIFKFFDPIRPSNVRINFNKKGLHSGTADVFFDTYEDAQLAMKRHKDQIGNRYIELFFDGKIKVGGGGGGGGGGNNNMSNNNFSRRI